PGVAAPGQIHGLRRLRRLLGGAAGGGGLLASVEPVVALGDSQLRPSRVVLFRPQHPRIRRGHLAGQGRCGTRHSAQITDRLVTYHPFASFFQKNSLCKSRELTRNRALTSCEHPRCSHYILNTRTSKMAQHQGGKGNFAEDPQRASEAGKKGGQASGGNFKNDPQRASEAGKKGGQASHGGGRSSGSK